MKWTILIIAAVLVAILLFMRTGKISVIDAREHLKQGALVIDVRSPGEYNSEHLPTAVNIPVDVIETALPVRVPDKNKVLLLHCRSGMRSAAAVKKLKSIGYTHVYDLGSLPQAKAVVDGVDDK
jgi:rhodanese-related sulfurtransferase